MSAKEFLTAHLFHYFCSGRSSFEHAPKDDEIKELGSLIEMFERAAKQYPEDLALRISIDTLTGLRDFLKDEKLLEQECLGRWVP